MVSPQQLIKIIYASYHSTQLLMKNNSLVGKLYITLLTYPNK